MRLFLASLALAAQTSIPPTQLRPSTAEPVRLVAVTADGFRFVELGFGLQISNGRLVITRPAMPWSLRVYDGGPLPMRSASAAVRGR